MWPWGFGWLSTCPFVGAGGVDVMLLLLLVSVRSLGRAVAQAPLPAITAATAPSKWFVQSS
jgi:hypothetical protein